MVTKLEASPSITSSCRLLHLWVCLLLYSSKLPGLFGHKHVLTPSNTNNTNKQQDKSLYLVINVAVLVLVTLRRHVLGLALVGPSFLAVVQIGAVGVQRRLQVGQQGICTQHSKSAS